ncbi:MAG: alcohol dehydrogenase catalytic domain-containing protein [Prolixibacteraceae bacterium]|jgi:L-iditol 2-dehydrogenase|nr:alcohol dehydrogenase catalytic domain-containing protein [Prolixibacteraceae bacterium]MBT6004713.1 alcohol dehydrogenase catalytic domain-containing protein [Prolixibacteraceae bacterium]MBT6765083.1 alcohol dehydrogenase catalytic domain-containing protein [Prolixibacteraceae bacterium]MBT6997154.1 alcohol dehydrogenase catalytic domain-containing protein [Prolixibacteraceae bacterium]MBT7393547.1 alcohol dehydrogenase catalytic domain-containing protein [Prolixibacteraceae bacterium]
MKQVVLTGIRKMKLFESAVPSILDKNDVKIKLAIIGVCGSDIHYYSEGKIGTQVVEFPFPVGHECSGTIEEIGEDVTNVKVGDLVVVDPAVHCGECDQCLLGRPHTCRNGKFLGCPGQLDGCLAEYIVMPEFTCFPVSGKLSPVQAALIEPLTIGVYTVNLAQIQNKDITVGIFGAGPIGLSVLMKLLADGITNIGMIEPLEYRLKKAKEIGVAYLINPEKENVEEKVTEQEKLLLDVVFEASGEQAAVTNAINILKPGGKLVLVGIPPEAKYTFNMDLMRRKELTVINVRRQNHCVEEAIDLVVSGKIDVEKMVTHNFTLEETPIAFDIVEGYKDGAIKAMINL